VAGLAATLKAILPVLLALYAVTGPYHQATLPPTHPSFPSPPPTAGPSCEVLSALPYPYMLPLHRTALVMIDFQVDFMCEGGFGAALGNDVSLLRVSGCYWERQHFLP
jgi:hypothetical protein